MSLSIISIATSGIVHISLVNGQVDALHEQAQADRSQTIEAIAEALVPFDQAVALGARSKRIANQLPLKIDKPVLSIIDNAHNQQADSIDIRADAISTSTSFNLYIAEVILVIGSAIAGGTISWAITQFLINRDQSAARIARRTE